MSGLLLDQLWYSRWPSLGVRLLGAVLTPLSWGYRAGLALRSSGGTEQKVDRPVVSVGNLTVGGSGKTPLVIELVGMLSKAGKKVAVVSRGYGRITRGTLVVHLPGSIPKSAAEAGDEPVLIAARCPEAAVVVGEDRVAAAELAVRVFEPEVIVCDDAFQHRRLGRDLDVVTVHAEKGFGNGWLLPRGPMRESRGAVRRAHLVVFTNRSSGQVSDLRRRHQIPEEIPAAACTFEASGFTCGPELTRWVPAPKGPTLAACAIANPEGFFQICRRAGLRLVGTRVFPDHHRFTSKDVSWMESQVERQGAETLVVTEKDLVRLAPFKLSVPVCALRIEVRWIDEESRAKVDSLFTLATAS